MAARPAASRAVPLRSEGRGLYVSDLQRGRLLDAAFALVYEQGYTSMTVLKVSERAGVSNRTFYELFSDREDCFLAAFEHALDGLAAAARPAYEAESEWAERVRAGLATLLETLDREPAARRLVFIDVLTAGPRVLERRAKALQELTVLIDEGRADMRAPGELPPLTAEGIVGATFGVIHARLSHEERAPIAGLLNGLMSAIVFPYRGSEAATRELARPTPQPAISTPLGAGVLSDAWPLSSASPVDYRLTIRTQMALTAVAELGERGGNPNNREVSEHIALHDQGQVSRLMARLQEQSLIENTRAIGRDDAKNLAKAWRLTPHGRAVIDAHRGGRALVKAQRKTGRGGKLVAPRVPSGRRGKHEQIAAAGTDQPRTRIRMTVLTREVLTVISELGKWGASPSNREIANAAGVKDEGQISRLLARLQAHGLLENRGGRDKGANAWRLTPRGEELLKASRSATPGAGR
jgi:AcrR family transcriptional regulator/DNA-binding MarR family transcriptional regulator